MKKIKLKYITIQARLNFQLDDLNKTTKVSMCHVNHKFNLGYKHIFFNEYDRKEIYILL